MKAAVPPAHVELPILLMSKISSTNMAKGDREGVGPTSKDGIDGQKICSYRTYYHCQSETQELKYNSPRRRLTLLVVYTRRYRSIQQAVEDTPTQGLQE